MIRYSAYHTTDHHAKRSALCNSLCLLEAEYRELQNLRRRVKSAEAAAKLAQSLNAEASVQQRPVASADHHRLLASLRGKGRS
jgi:hypothetical protein